jgi:phytoene/squalene synthetase
MTSGAPRVVALATAVRMMTMTTFGSRSRRIRIDAAGDSVTTARTTTTTRRFSSTHNNNQRYCIDRVRDHDAAAYLPGRLLPAHQQRSYFAIRAFWIETGLRFGSSAAVPPNSTPLEHLEWWQQGVDKVVLAASTEKAGPLLYTDSYSSATSIRASIVPLQQHPVLQELQHLRTSLNLPWTKRHFDDVLIGRRQDLDVRQYESMADLIHHAELSCGSLIQLILESSSSGTNYLNAVTHPASFQAARLVGICHGLTMQLRHSIPLLSVTGKLIIPAELTTKYGVQSPRYLLSAPGQGDAKCIAALQLAVEEIATVALDHLYQARALRNSMLAESNRNSKVTASAVTAALLPGIASETFLHRLARYKCQLTNRDLRHVGMFEHATCAARIVKAYWQSKY